MSTLDGPGEGEPTGPVPQKKGVIITDAQGKPTPAGVALGSLFVSFVIVALIYACSGPSSSSGPSEFTYPDNIMDHHMSAVDGRNELNITLKLQERSDGGFFLSEAPFDMEKILKHEQQQSSGEDDLVFHVVGDIGGGYNNYGNPIPSNVVLLFDMRYTKFDIMQINWEHRPSPGGLLNIGTVSNISGYGASAGQSYCQEAREWSQVFCENF
jgi:hypothetical protein